ncbi:hypothetical protein [Paraburkholderia acidisoli]|uniref:Uncharacterized protein n=1 Tax=Paraburkholderia acidisoli TaxID=2571748 RepID=A0A7Z2GN97_9BURK|nr:hypothetical protein [Paraburkholderia acidisoli]QGZ64932.1 hypothetical protein FAZ98_24325 [Paraburkholderia acidisoli]
MRRAVSCDAYNRFVPTMVAPTMANRLACNKAHRVCLFDDPDDYVRLRMPAVCAMR